MSRLHIPTRDQLPEETQGLLAKIAKRFGKVPAIFRLIASSPPVLQGYLSFAEFTELTLDPKLRMRMAVAVSQANGCDYCLSANSYVALNLGRIGPEEIALNRAGKSGDVKADAAVRFASKVAEQRGRVTDEELEAVRAVGYTDHEIVEMVAIVGLSVFANFLNEVAQTEIDFPISRTACTKHTATRDDI